MIPTESQIVFDVYLDVAAAMLKNYISVQYSYFVLSIDEKGTSEMSSVWYM